MNREPCSITDAPFNEYSDYVEREGVYKSRIEEDEDAAYERARQEEIDSKTPLELYAVFINSLMEKPNAKQSDTSD